MAESPFSLRLPGDLRRLVETEAKKHGQTIGSYIVGACWAQLERHGGDGRGVAPKKTVLGHAVVESAAVPVDSIALVSKPTMEDLRAICDGNVRPSAASPEVVAAPPVAHEIPICGKTWWEDGEHWECLMDAGHREFKHGLRGMVRKLDE